MSENVNNSKSYKTPLYTTLAVVMTIAGLALICGIVLLVLWYDMGYSVWMFGCSSSELLPGFIAVSVLLVLIPLLVILMCEKSNLRKILIPVCILSVAAAAAFVIISAMLEPEKNYYSMESDEALYEIIACEMSKDGVNNVIFYQKIDGMTMRRISNTQCLSSDYRPISSGYAHVRWTRYGFVLVFPNSEGEYVIEQVYSFIRE